MVNSHLRTVLFATGLLAACLPASSANLRLQQSAYFKPVPVGHPAPNFTVYTAEGQKVTLAQFKGQVVILDFWATWCEPCQISMPGLENIYGQIKDKKVVVLSVDTWDRQPDFRSWVKENSGTKYHFTFVRDPAEGGKLAIRKASIAKRLYKVFGIPTMYVIDRQGNVAGSVMGAGNDAELVKILAKLNLKATAPKDRLN